MKNTFLLVLLVLIYSGCEDDKPVLNGMKPAYISYSELFQVEQLPPQPVVNAGKILLYNSLLFLGETNKGIHVIDMSDTLNPTFLSYIKIPGNKDFSAQNDRLYADNGPDFLVLNIENINSIFIVQRKSGYFEPSEFFPPNYSGPFECTDYSKGWLVGWQEALLEDPKCNR